MNTKQRTIIILAIGMSMILSTCGPGQLSGPTVTSTATLTPTATPTAEVTAEPYWMPFHPADDPLSFAQCSKHADGFSMIAQVSITGGAPISFNDIRAVTLPCVDDSILLRLLAQSGLVPTMRGSDGKDYYSAQPPGCSPSECTPVVIPPENATTIPLYVKPQDQTGKFEAVTNGYLLIGYPTPTPTVDPCVDPYKLINTPQEGAPMSQWGWSAGPGRYGIQVWGSNAKLVENDFGSTNQGDPNNNLSLWGPHWNYLGQVDGDTITRLDFGGKTYTNIGITFRGESGWAIDSITGFPIDGPIIPFGYAQDAKGKFTWEGNSYSPTSLFADGGGLPGWDVFIKNERANVPQEEPCGVVGFGPDKIVTRTNPRAEILFRMLNQPFEIQLLDLGKRGNDSYSLAGIEIVAYKATDLPPDVTYCE